MSAIDLANIGLGSVRRIVDLWSSSRADSLIDYTKVARVEPFVLIDSNCLFAEMTPDVMQSLQSIFTGYYLQAVAVSANIGNVSVLRQLDKLNPNRDALDGAASLWMLTTENYKDALPTFEGRAALEAVNPDRFMEENGPGAQPGRDSARATTELANLSVGKMVSVEISDGQHRGSIPIAIRLIASQIPSSNLAHILSQGNQDTSVSARWHGWRSGRLEFVKDLLLCNDLIEERRKNLMADKDGIYSNIIKRQRNNAMSTLVSGNPSVATASNMVVMDTTTLADLELKINGKMSDFKTRQQIFKETALMIVAVIDPSWDRVTFYHRGIPQATSLSARELKAANKGTGPDVSDILKAYQLGTAPSL